jgi:hypothetical protein
MVEVSMDEFRETPAGRRPLLLLGSLTLLALLLTVLTGARVAPPPLVGPRATLPEALEPFRLPEPAPLEGRVVDAETQRPIPHAALHSRGEEIRADAEGRFRLAAPGFPLVVKAPGYERRTLEQADSPLTVALRPGAIRAAYLTYYGVGDPGIRGRVLDLVARTSLNAVVIDVKGDRGWIPYRTEVPLALEAGAQGPMVLRDFDRIMADLKARNVYTIARIVTFKDDVLANHRPEWAVTDARTGRPWVDLERLAWLDPFREEAWDYVIAIAKEAARKGFDEIQFDYIRFPGDGQLAAARFSRPSTQATRLAAIAGFLAKARRELAPYGVFLAIDIFGYTAFNDNDSDIGQRVEELAPHVDYLSPMVYPSSYHRGIPRYTNPVEHPYEVVFETVRLIRKRAAHAPVRIRPWLQNFRDYGFDRRPFGEKEVRAQMKGAADGGAVGWMLWNPRNVYTEEALVPAPRRASEGSVPYW